MFTSTNSKARNLIVTVVHDRKLVWELIDQWHSLLRHSQGWKVAFVLSDGIVLVGVATWGRPVARLEDQKTTLELTRMALSDDAPYNAATYFSGRMRKWIRENMPDIKRLISYQDEIAHDGAFYKADNWTLVYSGVSRSPNDWQSHGSNRRADSGRKKKAKWERKP